jgi:hypothetical protein
MSLSRFRSIHLVGAIVAGLASGGCQTPWPGGGASRWDTSQASPAAGVSTDGRSATADAATPLPDVRLGSTSTGDEQAMVAVLDDLQQVGQIDPTAQQELLEQLRKTEPAMRPLVAQQFRASLAYHQQLAARSTAPPTPTTASGLVPDCLASPEREGGLETLGSLVDPRQLRGDTAYEDALAQATPAAIPVPGLDDAGAATSAPEVPRAFAAEPDSSPLAQREEVVARSMTSTMASFNANDGRLRGVEPAVLHTLSAGPAGSSAFPDALPAEEEERHSPPDPLSVTTDSRSNDAKADWRQLVDEAAADLSRRVPDSPQCTAEVHQHVSLRILELLAGHTEEALRPIPDISPAEQEYWSAQLFELATYLDHHARPDEKRRAAAAAVHLDEALAHLREVSALSVRNLSFCKQVYGYGVYEPCDSDSFAPGLQISLYAEVENYRSDSTEKGYSTALGTSYKIVNDKNERVDGGQFPDVEDCCRSRRRDFHIQYGLTVPKDIEPGTYRLELLVKDRLSDKIGHAYIPLKIGGSRP